MVLLALLQRETINHKETPISSYTKNWIIRQRFLIIQAYQLGMKVKDICLTYKISRKTFYKWLKIFGKEGLLDLPRKPKSNPRALPEKIKRKIIYLRKKTNLGPERLK